MSTHTANISWERGDAVFTDNEYSRAHTWTFDGGTSVAASPSPDVVPVPQSDPANVDPEEAFVASLASCHMLFFLAIAAKRGFVVDSYIDEASGIMGKDSDGRVAITHVTLRPNATYSGDKIPTVEQLRKMHHRSHDLCFIANSVKTEITTNIIA